MPWAPGNWKRCRKYCLPRRCQGHLLRASGASGASLELFCLRARAFRAPFGPSCLRPGAPSGRAGPIQGGSGGVRSAWRIGRGGSRSTFEEIDFFLFGYRLGLDFAPPEALLGAPLTFSDRSLGGLVRSWGAPAGPQGRPRSLSGRVLERSWAHLGAL